MLPHCNLFFRCADARVFLTGWGQSTWSERYGSGYQHGWGHLVFLRKVSAEDAQVFEAVIRPRGASEIGPILHKFLLSRYVPFLYHSFSRQ